MDKADGDGPVDKSVTASAMLRLPDDTVHEVTFDATTSVADFMAACAEHFGLHAESWRLYVQNGDATVHLDDAMVISSVLREYPDGTLYLYPEFVAAG